MTETYIVAFIGWALTMGAIALQFGTCGDKS